MHRMLMKQWRLLRPCWITGLQNIVFITISAKWAVFNWDSTFCISMVWYNFAVGMTKFCTNVWPVVSTEKVDTLLWASSYFFAHISLVEKGTGFTDRNGRSLSLLLQRRFFSLIRVAYFPVINTLFFNISHQIRKRVLGENLLNVYE